MSKVVCKHCNHDLFRFVSRSEIQCKYCMKVIIKANDLVEKVDFKEMSQDEILADSLLYHTRIIGRINIIKKKIDQALDKGEKDIFLNYSSELRQLEMLLDTDKAESI